MNSPLLRHARASLARSWASRRLWLLALAVALAVAATGSVALFTQRVAQALSQQSAETLGANAQLSGRSPYSPATLAAYRAKGLAVAEVVEFPSVVMLGEQSVLAAIKAVGPGYPLRGVLRTSTTPFGVETPSQARPSPGTVWADVRLLQALNAQVGSRLQLGLSTATVSAVLTYEPDRGGGMTSLAPRLLLPAEALAATGLLAPGSRASYRLQLAGPPAALAAGKALAHPTEQRWQTPEDARPELKSALARASQFLSIASLAAALLAAAAIALSARQHGVALAEEVALLKTLGASRRFVLGSLALQLLALGTLASALGAVVALAGQAVLTALLGQLMAIALPPLNPLPLLGAAAVGLLLLLGFALPPVMAAANTPPSRVLARNLAPSTSRWLPLAAAAATALLLWWQTGDAALAGRVLLGAAAACAGLFALGWLAVAALAPLRSRGGQAWRFGMGNIARRRSASVAQMVALGLALLALLLMLVVQHDLLHGWQKALPPRTPNQFLINIQPAQRLPLQQFLAQQGLGTVALSPMLRGRLLAVNGKAANAQAFPDPEVQSWINREFNLTATAHFGSDNSLQQGAWWGPAQYGQPLLSVDEWAVERLHLKLGDTLTLDIAGTEYPLRVYNIRKVRWDSFKPNFFIAVPPGLLDSAPQQFIGSFYLAPQARTLLPKLVAAFPNVTPIDLDATLNQVRSVVDRVTRAVGFVFLFALAAGALVLLAAIEGTRSERQREIALLRTLGASRRQLRAGLLAEYATLGLLAGGVATTAAQGIAWLLAKQVFELPFTPSLFSWLLGAAGSALLVAALGYGSLRGVLNTPPRQVLS